jgi:predicted nucleic acid-binding protein
MRLMFWTTGLTMHPITRDVLEQAAHLRAKYKGLRTPDAIHLASAMTRHCGAFVTNDVKLKIVNDLTIVLSEV